MALAPMAWADLSGSYRLVPSQSDDVDKAIDTAVRKMNVVSRGFARRRLRSTNPPYERIILTVQQNHVRVTAGGSTLTLPTNGSAVPWKRGGEVLSVSGRFAGGSFVETFQAKDGRRVNTFTATEGGLDLRVTVTSARLPAPLTYRLRYRRE